MIRWIYVGMYIFFVRFGRYRNQRFSPPLFTVFFFIIIILRRHTLTFQPV